MVCLKNLVGGTDTIDKDALNLVERMTLDERGDLGATEVEEAGDVKVESTHQNIVEKGVLLSIDLVDELSIEAVAADFAHIAGAKRLLNKRRLSALVVVHVTNDSVQNSGGNINFKFKSIGV